MHGCRPLLAATLASEGRCGSNSSVGWPLQAALLCPFCLINHPPGGRCILNHPSSQACLFCALRPPQA